MEKIHLVKLKFIVLFSLYASCITSTAAEIKTCPKAFQSLSSAVKEYSELMRDTEIQLDNPVKLMQDMEARISREAPERVMEIVSDRKEEPQVRQTILEFLLDILSRDQSVKSKYTTEANVKILTEVVFDRENSDSIRGHAISILSSIYKEVNTSSVSSLLVHRLQRVLSDKTESDYIKRQVIHGLIQLEYLHITEILEGIIIDGRESVQLQRYAIDVLVENRDTSPEIIEVLVSKLLNIQSQGVERTLGMIKSIVDALYTFTVLHESYRFYVEELIGKLFFGVGVDVSGPAPVFLRMSAIPPDIWPLSLLDVSSLHHQFTPKFFRMSSTDRFKDTETLIRELRNRTFLNLEYSNIFSMTHALYFLLLNKKEDPLLRIRVLFRLYIEDHPFFPDILVGIISDAKENELVKYAAVTMVKEAAVVQEFSSQKYFYRFRDMQLLPGINEAIDTKKPEERVNHQLRILNNMSGETGKENIQLHFKRAVEMTLEEMRDSPSTDPSQRRFLEALSQPELIKNRLYNFVADWGNIDSIMKGLIIYALHEWGMLSYRDLIKVSVDRSRVVHFDMRLMALRKIADDLPLLKKSNKNGDAKTNSAQHVDTFIVEGLLNVFRDVFETPALRTLAAEALSQIQPSAPQVQREIIAILSNPTDRIIKEEVHHFQWIDNLPVHLRPPDNVRKIK